MQRLTLVLVVLLCGARPLLARTYATSDDGIILAPGDTFASADALVSLRANGSDRFVLPNGKMVKLRRINGSPITKLRSLGVVARTYVYAAADDTTAIAEDPERYARFEAGGYRFVKDTVDAIVPSATVDGPYRGVETDQGVDLTNLSIRGFTAKNVGRDGMRFRNIDGGVIEDVTLIHSSVANILGELPQGIAIYKGQNITIRRADVSGFQTILEYDGNGKPRFRNGDGIATEGRVNWLLIEDSIARNNSDAGFDIKGTSIVLRNLTAINNSRGYRIWSADVMGYNLKAVNFSGAGLWLGEGASITVDKFTASSTTPGIVFRWEKNARLIVRSCDLTGMAKGSILSMADGTGASVSLGAGCTL